MLVHRDGVLDCSLQQFSLAISAQGDRAIHLARECTTVDELASHSDLRLQGQPNIRILMLALRGQKYLNSCRPGKVQNFPSHPNPLPCGEREPVVPDAMALSLQGKVKRKPAR